MNIQISHSFFMPCAGQDIQLMITADNSFTSELNGVTGQGSDFTTYQTYTIPTSNVPCGSSFNNSGQALVLNVNASNSDQGQGCANNPEGLIFAVTTADCRSCLSGSFYSAQQCGCTSCSTYLTGCATCTSSTSCTSCVSNSYLLSGGQCHTCSSINFGCLTCSSSTVCLSCDTRIRTIILNNFVCTQCSIIMPHCHQCSASSRCDTCDSGYAPYASGCSLCSSLIVGCQLCSSSTVCISCDSVNNFMLVNYLCQCNTGYVLNGTACSLCSGFIVGCLSCSSTTVCTLCNSTSNFILEQGVCHCKPYYALSGSGCLSCGWLMVGCDNCSNSTTCITCSGGEHFISKDSSCDCSKGYALDGLSCKKCEPGCILCTAQRCTDFCGDGVVNGSDCDDGNTKDGDGCSSICAVEENYTCKTTRPYYCSYNKPLELGILSVTKADDNNTLNIAISVSPLLQDLNSTTFRLTVNNSNATAEFGSYSNGTLTFTLHYTADISNGSLMLTINANSAEKTYAIPNSSVMLEPKPANFPAYYFAPSVYQEVKQYVVVTVMLIVVCLVLSLVDLFLKRKVGMELLQFLFLRCLIAIVIKPNLFSLQLRKILQVIGFSQVSWGIQTVITVALLIVLAGVALYMGYLFSAARKRRRCYGWSMFLLGDALALCMLGSISNTGYALSMLVQNKQPPTYFITEVIALQLIGCCIFGNASFKAREMADQGRRYITPIAWARRHHIKLCCAYRILMGLMVGVLQHSTAVKMLPIFFQFVYCLYVSVVGPYREWLGCAWIILLETNVLYSLCVATAESYLLPLKIDNVRGLRWSQVTLFAIFTMVTLAVVAREIRKPLFPMLMPDKVGSNIERRSSHSASTAAPSLLQINCSSTVQLNGQLQ